MSERINPCFDCQGQCCQNFLISQMIFNHPHWSEILDRIQQQHPYIRPTGKFYPIEDHQGQNRIPYLRCNLFDIQTGLCTSHDDNRPDFCLNTGENQPFSPDCALRHHYPEKKPSKLSRLTQFFVRRLSQ